MLCKNIPCSTATGTLLTNSITDKAYLGIDPLASSNFTGFVSVLNLFNNYLSATNSASSNVVPTGSDLPLVTSSGVACNCGGYSCYNNDPNLCLKCDPSCSDVCTSYSSSGCINIQASCSPYYYNSTLGACDYNQIYINGCAVMNSILCQQCNAGYVLSPTNDTCCAIGTYFNISSCSSCYHDCASCNDYPSCLACNISAAYVNAAGNCQCNSSYYQSGSNPLACTECHIDCATCNGATVNNCLTCVDTNAYTASPGACICKSGYYQSGSSPLVCTKCNSDCATCNGSTANNCLTCIDINAYTANPGACVCNHGYYQSGSNPLSCTKCNDDCSTCNGSTANNCLSCADTNAYTIGVGPCICNIGYYASSSAPLICTACNADCKTCTGITINDCLSCQDSNAIIASVPGLCICKANYYEIQNSPLICNSCYIDCNTCNDSTANNCLTCSGNYSLVSSSGSCICDNEYYQSGTSPLVCTPCYIDCKTCNGPTSTNCLNCKDNNAQRDDSGSCNCTPSYFALSTSPLVCSPCYSDCLTCTDSNQNSCLSCKDTNKTVISGICTCKPGYFLQGNSCGKCSTLCNTCISTSSTACTSCIDSKMSILTSPGGCICPYGMIISGAICIPCYSLCKECNDIYYNNCTSCSSDKILINNECICNKGHFMTVYQNCLKCTDNCQNCSNSTTCNICFSGYYYNQTSSLCEACDNNCKECIGPKISDCISCSNSSIIPSKPSGNCTCMDNYYISNLNPIQCKACPDSCAKCTFNNCIFCDKGYKVSSNGLCEIFFFNLTISVNNNNQMFLIFSDDLLNQLESTDFITIFESKLIPHALDPINSRNYTINVTGVTITSTSNIIYIVFIIPIVSKMNSTLENLNYSCSLLPEPNTYANTFLSAAKTAVQAVMAVAGAVGVSSVFSGNQVSFIWTSLNTIQIICCIPLQNITLPPFLYNFLLETRPMKILPNFWIKYFYYTCITEQIITPFREYDFECKYFITNTGEITFVLIFLLGFFPILLLFYIITSGKVKKYFLEKLQNYKWNAFLRFSIESFIDILIPCVITLNTVLYK